MKVKITINGDAMIYERNDAWNVTFITDEYHKLDFWADGVLVDSLRRAGVTRNLSIITGSSSPRKQGDDFDKILDMNHHSLHGLDSLGNSNLIAKQNSGPDRELIHMTVPVGTVSGNNLVEYWYAEYPGGTKHDLDQKVAREIKIVFVVEDESSVKVELSDPSKTYEYPSQSTLDLLFDNDCEGLSTEDDFLHYYDWVSDKRSTSTHQIRFITGKKAAPGASPETSTGNCDPTSVMPPPELGS